MAKRKTKKAETALKEKTMPAEKTKWKKKLDFSASSKVTQVPEASENKSEIFDSSSDSGSDDDDCCQLCKKSYKDDKYGEEWITCSRCYVWSHEECDAAIKGCKNVKKYVCTTCLNLSNSLMLINSFKEFLPPNFQFLEVVHIRSPNFQFRHSALFEKKIHQIREKLRFRRMLVDTCP